MKAGKRTINKDNFKLNQSTVFLNIENKIREIRKGQKEVWTAKKGLVNNIYSDKERLET